MSDYRHGAYTVFSMHLHIVWITQSRHAALRGAVVERVRAIVCKKCQKAGVVILQSPISTDHVPVLVSLTPYVTISWLVQWMQGESSYRVRAECLPTVTVSGPPRRSVRRFMPTAASASGK